MTTPEEITARVEELEQQKLAAFRENTEAVKRSKYWEQEARTPTKVLAIRNDWDHSEAQRKRKIAWENYQQAKHDVRLINTRITELSAELRQLRRDWRKATAWASREHTVDEALVTAFEVVQELRDAVRDAFDAFAEIRSPSVEQKLALEAMRRAAKNSHAFLNVAKGKIVDHKDAP